MKKVFLLLVCVMIFLCGCTSQKEKDQINQDSFTLSADHSMYDSIIEDYQNIVSFRTLDDFEYFWNYGEFIEISDPLLSALTVSGSDLDYRWSNMIVEMPSPDSAIDSFGYILADINNDGTPELFWVRDDHSVLAVFTVFEDKIILLDAFWSRYPCVITDEGALYTMGSGGASVIDYNIRALSDSGMLTTKVGFSMYNENYSEFINGEMISVSRSRFDKLIIEYPFENSQRWLNTEITPLFHD